ncbi:hypothetical protein [Eremococcus coleocola]|uniref:Uncharacterized protein n=1 Tax=Eremococcus coleocola ACS-139-V-Col8 TaxID=908337 RepID=E4KLW6_9LACT|nr:hypothetical protein [Eremococcus coleocola]EFR31991.1 hypothetical protein HMPREF9257_0949 [Eremococcus coleocola ACS-139-V-Col8]
MLENGNIIEAKVSQINDDQIFVQNQGQTLKVMDQAKQEYKLGQVLEGIVYQDKYGDWCFQEDLPMVRFDSYDWASVVDVHHELGVFVNIGLANKDIAVSLDDLPDDHAFWPKRDSRLFVTLTRDKKNRLWAKLGDERKLSGNFRRASERLKNQDLQVTVYQLLSMGVQTISTEGYKVFIHESELADDVHLGQVLQVRIVDVHADGRLNGSSKPRAYEMIDQDGQMILNMLKRIPSHFLALHDKSHPTDIVNQLGISKKQFKRALGGLLKERLVKQVKGEGIYLNDESSQSH